MTDPRPKSVCLRGGPFDGLVMQQYGTASTLTFRVGVMGSMAFPVVGCSCMANQFPCADHPLTAIYKRAGRGSPVFIYQGTRHDSQQQGAIVTK